MNALINSLDKVIQRDLEKLQAEISSYPNEESIWLLKGDIKNTAGNLCLHLCGNLQHFIGKILGGSDYVRDRDREFAVKNVPTKNLLAEIENTKKAVALALTKLDPSVLEKDYPIQVFNEPMTTNYFLLHLAGHLNYHLGQINYHRRLLAAEVGKK
jgi:uncharacterized damage-inducible protein DinB